MTRQYRFPSLARYIYRDAVYRGNKKERKVYLTFDDSPTSGGTPVIIDILRSKDVNKAVFFCNGTNILEHPSAVSLIRNSGYTIANHGYKHLNGWRTPAEDYIENCVMGSGVTGSSYFRPPYGHLTYSQYKRIRSNMRIVFWDILLYDYDIRISRELILSKAKKLLRNGSVIVLHDKENKCSVALLDKLIDLCHNKGYIFGDLTEDL